MKGGMALVTFNPWGVVQVKINRISTREMLLFQVKGDRATMQHTMHLQSKWASSIACALGSYWPPLSAISLLKKKNDLNVLTNIKARAITPNQINSPMSCMSSRPTSMILEKKKACHLKIRLDLPHEMARWIARSVKMNNSAPRNCGRKPCHFGTV